MGRWKHSRKILSSQGIRGTFFFLPSWATRQHLVSGTYSWEWQTLERTRRKRSRASQALQSPYILQTSHSQSFNPLPSRNAMTVQDTANSQQQTALGRTTLYVYALLVTGTTNIRRYAFALYVWQ